MNLVLHVKMDQKNEAKIVCMPPILVNNPSISIIPTRSNKNPSTQLKNQSLASAINKIPQVSPPVSFVPVINKQDQSAIKSTDSNNVKTNIKRSASNTFFNRPEKQSKFSVVKATKSPKEKPVDLKLSENISKLNHITSNQVKKMDSSLKLNNVNATPGAASTSSSGRVSQELTNPQPSKKPTNTEGLSKKSTNTEGPSKKPTNTEVPSKTPTNTEVPSKKPTNTNTEVPSKKPTITDLNCKVESTIIDVEKNPIDNLKQFSILNNSEFNYEINDSTTFPNSCDMYVQISFDGEIFKIKRSDVYYELLTAMSSVLHEHLSKEELGAITQNSAFLKSPEHWSSETKDVSLTNSKLNPVNHNNVSTSKDLSPSQCSLKSQRKSATQQQPCTSKQSISPTKVSTSCKQTTSKIQQLFTKQNKLKHHHISNNQHPTSMKHPIATDTQMQSVNKQKLSTSPKCSVTQSSSVTNQLINVSQLGKLKAIVSQTSLQVANRCIKCKAISKENICTTCHMSSQLNGVTVTRIETPAGTQLKNGDNKVKSDVVTVSSDEDEEDSNKNRVEPVITKIESNDIINKYLEQLSLNSKLLEDKLQNKDFKDFFKLKHCHTMQIGSYSAIPSEDIFIGLHGIRMTIKDVDFEYATLESMTIDVEIKNIVKILGYYASDHKTIIIYTNYLAAVGIQHLLRMKKCIKSYYFDPLSQEDNIKKIVWSFDLKLSKLQQLEKLLLKLPKKKYEPLTKTQFNQIFMKSASNINEELSNHSVETPANPDDIPIYRGTLDDRQVSTVKISDYKTLSVDEHVSDILIEFYLSYWLMRKLSPENKNRTYLFNAHFYKTLTKKCDVTADTKSKNRHNKVKKWTKNVNVFEKDFIFVPIHEKDHCFMVVICFPHLSAPVHVENNTPIQISNSDYDPPYHTSRDLIIEELDEADGTKEDLWNFNIDYHERIGVNYAIDVANLKRYKQHHITIKQTDNFIEPTVYRTVFMQPGIDDFNISRIYLFSRPCILVFDSLCGGVDRARVVATLREWLLEEYRAVHHGAEKDFSCNKMLGAIVKVPQQQPNSTDGGLFMIHYFEKFFQCPIVDYNFPIVHLENWFNINEVTLNCKKRKEVQSVVLEMVAEQQLVLPPGVFLPDIIFTTKHSQNNSNTSNSLPTHHQRSQNQIQDYYNNFEYNLENSGSVIEKFINCDDIINSDDEEHPEKYDNMNSSYQPDGYNNMGDEYTEIDEVPDQREYFGEMVGQYNDEDYQTE